MIFRSLALTVLLLSASELSNSARSQTMRVCEKQFSGTATKIQTGKIITHFLYLLEDCSVFHFGGVAYNKASPNYIFIQKKLGDRKIVTLKDSDVKWLMQTSEYVAYDKKLRASGISRIPN